MLEGALLDILEIMLVIHHTQRTTQEKIIAAWVELCPCKGCIQVLTPSPCECDLIWKQGLCRRDQVKVRSY